MNAFDTAEVLTGKSVALKAAGITMIGVYARADRTPFDQVREFANAGFSLWSVYERGEPTGPEYFTSAQANQDVGLFLDWALMVGQPVGTPVFLTVDYDADPSDVGAYIETFHNTLKPHGFLTGVYGSGSVCSWAKNAGYGHFTWLAQSDKWDGYEG